MQSKIEWGAEEDLDYIDGPTCGLFSDGWRIVTQDGSDRLNQHLRGWLHDGELLDMEDIHERTISTNRHHLQRGMGRQQVAGDRRTVGAAVPQDGNVNLIVRERQGELGFATGGHNVQIELTSEDLVKDVTKKPWHLAEEDARALHVPPTWIAERLSIRRVSTKTETTNGKREMRNAQCIMHNARRLRQGRLRDREIALALQIVGERSLDVNRPRGRE